MSHLERKTKHGRTYVSFVKKMSFMGKSFVIKEHIGIDSITISKEKYLLDNLDSLSQNELQFRTQFLAGVDLSYSDDLSEKNELKAILIENLIEGKNCHTLLETEFAKEFIFNSNNIEGSKIPSDRVGEIINTGDTKYANRNEVKEVQNSILAFEFLRKMFKFNIVSIKRLYHILTRELVRDGNIPYPRGFKKEQNIVGNSLTTPPAKVVDALTELLRWYQANKKCIHPLVLAFEFHQRFEAIHPFLDGNGRVGRLIMNKILMSCGYYPIIVYKDNKDAYFSSIEGSRMGRSKKYYHFMMEQTGLSYDFVLQTIRRY